MFVAGAGVQGKQYYAKWTPLADDLEADLK